MKGVTVTPSTESWRKTLYIIDWAEKIAKLYRENISQFTLLMTLVKVAI